MKKIVALLIVAAMAVSMAACGGKKDDAGSAAGNASAAEESKEATGGTLIMATNATFPPYEYVEGDKIVGIDAEIAEAIAKDLGMELQIDDMEFDSIIAAVQSGKADMGVAGMTVNEDRLKNVNFSDSYATCLLYTSPSPRD